MRPAEFLLKSAVAGALVLGIILGVVALGEWITGPDDSPAPATKRAIAAVTVEVLDIEPTSYDVNPRWDVPVPLGVEIRFRPAGEQDSHYLQVGVGPADEPRPCNEHYECADWTGHGGRFHLSWQEEEPEEDPGILTLELRIGDEVRSVTYAGESITGDPREQDLPLSVEGDLVRLLADERLSRTTTRAMVDTDLPRWPKDDTRGDPVPTTPEMVAQWMIEDGVAEPPSGRPAETEEYGDGAVGARFDWPDRTVSVVLVPQDSPSVPACGPEQGWQCATRAGGEVTVGWRPGAAIAIRRTADAVMVGTITAPAIDRLPRLGQGDLGSDFVSLVRSYAADNLVTTREAAEGVDLDWFAS